MKTHPTAETPAGLARRSFLAGLAVTLPATAIAATPALAAPGDDAELIALSRQLSDLLPQKEAAIDEMTRCEKAHHAMNRQYPAAMLWRSDDPVPRTKYRHFSDDGQVRYWCSTDAIRKLPGRTFQQWDFIGTREEYERLSMQEFEPHEIRPLMHFEHCFRAKPDERKNARAKELLAALEDHQSNIDAVYEQSGMMAAEEGYEEITDRMFDLFCRIRDLKAETLEGYRAKALAVVINCWSGVIEPDDFGEESMLAAICSDLTGIPIKADREPALSTAEA